MALENTANGMDVNVLLKQRKKYGKEEEFKKHVPVGAGEVSNEEFKNMVEEPGEEQNFYFRAFRINAYLNLERKVPCQGYVVCKVQIVY